MQQSSSSIGNLAAALAKAQVKLVNPESQWSRRYRRTVKGGRADLSLRTAL